MKRATGEREGWDLSSFLKGLPGVCVELQGVSEEMAEPIQLLTFLG